MLMQEWSRLHNDIRTPFSLLYDQIVLPRWALN